MKLRKVVAELSLPLFLSEIKKCVEISLTQCYNKALKRDE